MHTAYSIRNIKCVKISVASLPLKRNCNLDIIQWINYNFKWQMSEWLSRDAHKSLTPTISENYDYRIYVGSNSKTHTHTIQTKGLTTSVKWCALSLTWLPTVQILPTSTTKGIRKLKGLLENSIYKRNPIYYYFICTGKQ